MRYKLFVQFSLFTLFPLFTLFTPFTLFTQLTIFLFKVIQFFNPFSWKALSYGHFFHILKFLPIKQFVFFLTKEARLLLSISGGRNGLRYNGIMELICQHEHVIHFQI